MKLQNRLLPSPRLQRRSAPSLDGLEDRLLLSLKGVQSPIVAWFRPEEVGGGIPSTAATAARISGPVKFIDLFVCEV